MLDSYLDQREQRPAASVAEHSHRSGLLGINKGYIKISYEFEGWNAFVDELDKKRNSTF